MTSHDQVAPAALQHLPTRTFTELYHVGTLDPADKGCHAESLEGDGLSVSLHPADWNRIARLGDAATWKLTSDTGIVLLDMRALGDASRRALRTWGISAGLLSPSKLWRVERYDPDLEERTYLLTSSEADARREFDDCFEWSPEDRPTIETVDGVVATAVLRMRMRHSVEASLADEFAILVYAADVAGMTGAWWTDRYAPAELSCPRGVIFPSRIADLRVTRS